MTGHGSGSQSSLGGFPTSKSRNPARARRRGRSSETTSAGSGRYARSFFDSGGHVRRSTERVASSTIMDALGVPKDQQIGRKSERGPGLLPALGSPRDIIVTHGICCSRATTDGITVRRYSRALFQEHRPEAKMRGSRPQNHFGVLAVQGLFGKRLCNKS